MIVDREAFFFFYQGGGVQYLHTSSGGAVISAYALVLCSKSLPLYLGTVGGIEVDAALSSRERERGTSTRITMPVCLFFHRLGAAAVDKYSFQYFLILTKYSLGFNTN
jgi:hypothetical protein